MTRLRALCAFSVFSFVLAIALPPAARAQTGCDPDGVQDSGAIYRICVPPPGQFNGSLVIFAHGFQDAGTEIGIPEDQLEFGDVSIPGLVNGLGFALATTSYSKTGLAVRQGMADILNLVAIYGQQYGPPDRIFLAGASEGGLITVLLTEQHPETFAGGLAACGPIGDFRGQINYLGDARVLFEVYFPGLIPYDSLDPGPVDADGWRDFYQTMVEPVVFAPENAERLMEYAAVARLAFDPADPIESLKISVEDVLRFAVVNFDDAVTTLGGLPYGNRAKWYTGSSNDLALNFAVERARAARTAIREMRRHYTTGGRLEAPVITLQTTLDQQVPSWHQSLYTLKTIGTGALFTRHLPIAIDRFEHCNFTESELLFAFAVLLLYTGDLDLISGAGSVAGGDGPPTLGALAEQRGLDIRSNGAGLQITPQ